MRNGYSTYCEDIRDEPHNAQYNLIGVYRGSITAESFPIILPKLCVVVSWLQSADEERLPVDFKVIFVPEKSGDEGLLVLYEDQFPIMNIKSTAPLSMVEAHVRLSPVQIGEPGKIGVRLYRGDEVIKLRALPLLLSTAAPEATTQAT